MKAVRKHRPKCCDHVDSNGSGTTLYSDGLQIPLFPPLVVSIGICERS
jgi:hypothetical protein